MIKPALRSLAPLFVVCLLSSPAQAEGGYEDDYGGDTAAAVPKKPKDPRARIEKARAEPRTQLEKARAGIEKATLEKEAYGIEGRDWNVAPTADLRSRDFHAPTPLTHASAGTITTRALRDLMLGPGPPVLIDVLGGQGHKTLPGAVWLKGPGPGPRRTAKRTKKLEARLTAILDGLTEGDRTRTLVFFCLSAECWLSYNATLRASALGWPDVRWYRGGTQAWRKAKLPMVWVQRTKW